jgi:opine dehydrogenase
MTQGAHLPVVAVVGAGNGGLATAGAMAARGAEVRVYDNDACALSALQASGLIVVDTLGHVEEAPIAIATSDPAEALRSATLIMVVVPASAHAAVAAAIAPYLQSDAVVVLNPGRTGGALETKRVFDSLLVPPSVTVAETQTLLFACRRQRGNKVVIMGVKRSVALAALPAGRTRETVELLRLFFPQISCASSVMETGLGNIGAVFHPTPTLLNVGRIESTTGDFDYYIDGISPSVARLLEGIDEERLSVARALDVPATSALRWLEESYGVAGCHSLYEGIHANPAYRGIRAPRSIDCRYVTEDVPTGLVPFASLARKVGVAVPLIEMVVDLACYLSNRNYRSEGRTFADLERS